MSNLHYWVICVILFLTTEIYGFEPKIEIKAVNPLSGMFSENKEFFGEGKYGVVDGAMLIENFVLKKKDGRIMWEKKNPLKNWFWISNDGKTVVGIRGPEDEGQITSVSFYDEKGEERRSFEVRGFSGLKFSYEGNMIFIQDSDGIIAYDRDGKNLWRVSGIGNYASSFDGALLAVENEGRILIYREGIKIREIALDANMAFDIRFSLDGKVLGILTGKKLSLFSVESFSLLLEISIPFFCSSFSFTEDGSIILNQEPEINSKLSGLNAEIGWCIPPQDSLHPIGNGWGEFQNYGGGRAGSYLHPGIDVMALSVGKECRAVEDGWVKAWLTISAQYHWRLAVSDRDTAWADSSDAWLYAHIDPNRPHKNIGDRVTKGEVIGYVVPWPVTGFDHIHFARIRNAGKVWRQATWLFIENPLNVTKPNTDLSAPVIEQALSNSKFAFCRNNTSTYLSSGNLTGDVDIVARIYDKFGQPIPANPIWERINPHKIEYEIHGPRNIPKTLSFYFAHKLEYNDTGIVSTIFKQDATCASYGDYSRRQYYYIVTNTDGDSVVEKSDTSGAWYTRQFPNGTYWVLVYASDGYGNTSVDSQQVVVNNPIGVEEIVGKEEFSSEIRLEANRPNPFFENTEISFVLPRKGKIYISVYNVEGRLIQKLLEKEEDAGRHTIFWNARDVSGKKVKSGVYFLRLRYSEDKSLFRKIVLVK